MDAVALSRVRLITAGGGFSFPATKEVCPLLRRRPQPVFAAAGAASAAFRTGISPVCELVEEEIVKGFLKERRLTGDFITKASDVIWRRDLVELIDLAADDVSDEQRDVQQETEIDDAGGFLKLSRTHEWVLGDDSAPVNRKAIEKQLRDDREKRKKLNLLNYEALKRELILVSVGVGTACSGYCLIVFSLQAALSYAVGVLFSLLYLQLLFRQADTLSAERVPQIFRQKKQKKIGIRSEDLSDALERWTRGSGIALSSPRLVIPATIFGIWALSDRFIANDMFHFELVPAMMGMFVYKAAALVQVYRDNEDLRFIFPESEEASSDGQR
ncbi:hypothetical protein MLD38_025298 [Melastoma candidum]|uniref:Uncharacterized protein n=1 Tax=Melastoma candidum TaxID=119954 RepID=A0ACB9NV17_9MYRT|nr:hypothetical protein MLD38_025298 [Melastoma candidum]